MYLARGKNGKLGRQTRGHHVKGVGYDMRTEEAPRSFRQRDVCVTNSSIVRDQYDDQLGRQQRSLAKQKKQALKEARNRAAARLAAEGRAEARHRQSLRGTSQASRNNTILKNYFGRRANMGEQERTVRDLVNAGEAVEASLSAIPENGEYQVPINFARQNGEPFNPQLMCNTAGPIPTPTSDFQIEYEVPDTEFQKILSGNGKDSRVDFMSQFPVGNPISRNGSSNTDESSYGQSTDWDRFVFDTEQNVTRAAGGYDVNKHSGLVVGNTILNRSGMSGYKGYGATKKKLRRSGRAAAMAGKPIQSNFGGRTQRSGLPSGGAMGSWYDPTSWFGDDSGNDLELDVSSGDPEYDREMAEYQAEKAAYDRELAEYNAELAADEKANQEPSWLDRLTGGIVKGAEAGLQTGVQTVAQQQIVAALTPEDQKRVARGLAPQNPPPNYGRSGLPASNPLTRAGASVGLTPTMTYVALGGVGLTLALLLLKSRKA